MNNSDVNYELITQICHVFSARNLKFRMPSFSINCNSCSYIIGVVLVMPYINIGLLLNHFYYEEMSSIENKYNRNAHAPMDMWSY